VQGLVVKIQAAFLRRSTKRRFLARLQGQQDQQGCEVVNRRNEKTPQKAAHEGGVRFGGRLMNMYINAVIECVFEQEFNRLIF
jgi:hypothetical protein